MHDYVEHRRKRVAQVRDALRRAPRLPVTATQLVTPIYGEALSASLIPAAAHNVLVALRKLERSGHARSARPRSSSSSTAEASVTTAATASSDREESEEDLSDSTTLQWWPIEEEPSAIRT